MIILGGDEDVQKIALYLIDASGLSKLMTGFLDDNEEKEISSPDWKNYFLQKTQYKYLIPFGLGDDNSYLWIYQML